MHARKWSGLSNNNYLWAWLHSIRAYYPVLSTYTYYNNNYYIPFHLPLYTHALSLNNQSYFECYFKWLMLSFIAHTFLWGRLYTTGSHNKSRIYNQYRYALLIIKLRVVMRRHKRTKGIFVVTQYVHVSSVSYFSKMGNYRRLHVIGLAPPYFISWRCH